MINITSITLRNFQSTGSITQSVKLDFFGLSLVLGANADVGGANSRNGVGKSTILQALSYGLYGQPISNIKLDNLINKINQKNMLVTIEFNRDGKSYRVERGRKPNLLKLYVNNTERTGTGTDEAQGENKQTQVEIEHIIGMSHTLFQHIVALNTSTKPFLRLNAAEQREVIEELLGIKQLTERADALKSLISNTKEAIRTEESTIKATSEANARIESAIARIVETGLAWQVAHDRKLKSLNEEIDEVSKIDFDAEIATFDAIESWTMREQEFQTGLAAIRKDVEALRRERTTVSRAAEQSEQAAVEADCAAQIARLEAEAARHDATAKATSDVQIARLRATAARSLTDAEAKRQEAEGVSAELAEITRQMENTDSHTCSTCGQGLDGTTHLKAVLAKLAFSKTTIEAKIARLNNAADDAQKQAENIEGEIADVVATHAANQQDAVAKAADIRNQIQTIAEVSATKQAEYMATAAALRDEVEVIGAAIAALGEEETAARDAIAGLGPKPTSSFRTREDVWKLRESRDVLVRDLEQETAKENPHEVQAESMRTTILPINYDLLNAHTVTQKHQDFLLKILTSRDSFVRKRIIEKNLSQLNQRLNHYLVLLGLPHEVRFMPDLTVEITLMGLDYDFESLSRGEMNRVILGTSWSFRDVWESMNTTVNLLMVDEIADTGMDDSGAEAGLAILDKMARERNKNVFLISHKDALIGRANRILMVHKENGFTSFEEGPVSP